MIVGRRTPYIYIMVEGSICCMSDCTNGLHQRRSAPARQRAQRGASLEAPFPYWGRALFRCHSVPESGRPSASCHSLAKSMRANACTRILLDDTLRDVLCGTIQCVQWSLKDCSLTFPQPAKSSRNLRESQNEAMVHAEFRFFGGCYENAGLCGWK